MGEFSLKYCLLLLEMLLCVDTDNLSVGSKTIGYSMAGNRANIAVWR